MVWWGAARPLVGLAVVAVTGACSHRPSPSPTSTDAGDAAAALDAGLDAQPDAAEDAGPDAAADAAVEAAVESGPPVPRVVLHVGDSTVGDGGGLELALEKRFKAIGTREFHHDAWVSASIWSVEHTDKLKKMLLRYRPDLVILTLGTNDVFHPTPGMLGGPIADIAHKAATVGGKRPCWWIGPPTWKKDLGLVAVIKDHAAPCRFFDSSLMGIERRPDGIHPTDKGGEEWATRFWDAYLTER